MKGVDRADQYLSYYSIVLLKKKKKKWTNRTVMFLLNGALFNAFRVFITLNSNKKKKILKAYCTIWHKNVLNNPNSLLGAKKQTCKNI